MGSRQLGVFVTILPTGGDASPSQDYPQQYVAGAHLRTWEKTDSVEHSFLSKEHFTITVQIPAR